jgi:hypothetical protein
MFFKQKATLPVVVFSALISLILSYAFGNDGYEAFVVTCIGLGILTARQSLELASLKQRWLVVQIILGIMLTIVGLAVIAILFAAISPELTNPNLKLPPLNWLIVAISSLPFLFRPITQASHQNLDKVMIHLITLIYSAIVLYGAAITYYKAESTMVGLILVLAVQMQYVMAYIVISTGYISIVQAFFANSGLLRSESGSNLFLLIVALPFFTPMIVIMLLSAIK